MPTTHPPVGLAAYAGAAVAKSDPIRTGIQGFAYDMRTAILPFMFFFNTDLLLHEVEGWGMIALIFFTGLMGMFAFAALLQGFTIAKNRVYESALLLASALLLLQPLVLVRNISALQTGPWESKWIWIGLGIALYATVFALQWPRRKDV